MSDGHPNFLKTSGRMSGTGLHPHLSFFGCSCMQALGKSTNFKTLLVPKIAEKRPKFS
jgi:hypothetical protein